MGDLHRSCMSCFDTCSLDALSMVMILGIKLISVSRSRCQL